MGTRDYPITADERRWIALWKECGGGQHGQNIEQAHIEYEKLFDFCRRVEEAARSALAQQSQEPSNGTRAY